MSDYYSSVDQLKLSLKSDASITKIVKFLNKLMKYGATFREFRSYAEQIKNSTFVIDRYLTNDMEFPDFILKQEIKIESEFQKWHKKQTVFRELLQQAAAGNAEAAIAYCKAEAAGEINHTAFA